MKVKTGFDEFREILEKYFLSDNNKSSNVMALFNLFYKPILSPTANDTAKSILIKLSQADGRIVITFEILRIIYQYLNTDNCREKAIALKLAIRNIQQNDDNSDLNWKDVLFGANYYKLLSAKYSSLEVDFRLGTNMTESGSRLQIVNSNSDNMSLVMGTTFCTNSKAALERNKQSDDFVTTHLLDSCYSARISRNDFEQIMIAVADGLGGHTGDISEDIRISKTSYFACKHAIRLCSLYHNPDQLKKQIPQIIAAIVCELKLKNPKYTDSTSLTCTVIYKYAEFSRIIGFNIGDSMLATWHPESKKLKTLLPGRHLTQMMGQGPAYLPANFTIDLDVDIIDEEVLPNTLVIAFTDGLTDVFNTFTTEERKDDRKYKLFHLEENDISTILSKVGIFCSSQDYARTLSKEILNRGESKRIQLAEDVREVNTKINDLKFDTSIISSITEEKSTLTESFDVLHQSWKDKIICDVEYNNQKEALMIRKKALQEKEQAYLNYQNELQAKSEIKWGDDLAIMMFKC